MSDNAFAPRLVLDVVVVEKNSRPETSLSNAALDFLRYGALAMFGYDVVGAVPPLFFENYSDAGTKKGADPHYGVMPPEAIKALPVHELARGDCLLLLWTTGWAIATGQATGGGTGVMHEPVLVCTVGNPRHKPFREPRLHYSTQRLKRHLRRGQKRNMLRF